MRRLLKYLSTAFMLGLLITLTIVIPVLAANFQPSTLTGAVGTFVSIDGSGFNANEQMELKFGTTVIDSISADASGNWSSGFTVPELPAGSYAILADRLDNLTDVSKNFTIIPSISLGKTSSVPNTSVTISGKGFAASSVISISFDDANVTPSSGIYSDGNGSWSSSFTVPAVASGDHSIRVYDSGTTVHEKLATFKTISNASIALNKSSGAGGTSLTVSGTDFVANENNIVVVFDNKQVGSPATASPTGTWSSTFNVPQSAGGSYTIDAYGALTKASEVADKTFAVTSVINLNKNSGPPGTQTTITGAGFAASEMGINVTWDGTPIGNPVNAGPTGAWTSTITVPTAAAGIHKINASGPTTTVGGADLVFNIGAGISTNKTSGTAGTTVSVSGNGFAASEKSITITFDTTTVASNITASAAGTWTANFNVPASSGGEHNIGAFGATTRATAVPAQPFITLPSVSIDTNNGTTGSKITISGSGFAPGQKGLAIMFDDQETSVGITANSAGAWTATFPVPLAASGSHTIKIAGAGVQDLSIDNLSFKVKPAVSLSPDSGTIGTKVTVMGTGFAANASLQFTFDGNPLSVLPRSPTDIAGNINRSFTVPEKSIAGEHIIRVSDGSNAFELNFTIDSTPPPMPKPAAPPNGQQIGFISKITPTFTWGKVTHTSSVTYTFQLDSNPDFTNPLEKSGLTAASYTLNKAEALPNGDYYWRVRAIDAATNASPWSATQYLKSGLMSPTLFFLILILVIAVLAVGIYFLLTKVIMKRQKAPALTSPEIVIPEIVNAEYRQLEGDKKALPWRLALPQAPQQPKGSKTLSSEDQARLRTIIDFAKSLPLPQPDSTTSWLVELAENNTGNAAAPALYSQLIKGEIQIRYEPAWMRHPTFLDLQALLEGQPVMQDLSAYVEAVNHSASSAVQVLQDIYRDISTEISLDLLSNGGWAYISGIYNDGVGWFQGKNLRDPSDRDYTSKVESPAGEEPVVIGLYGDKNTAFVGLLVKANSDTEIQQLRSLHLKMRRNCRNSERMRDLVNLISQIEVQRNRLLTTFSQFTRLNT